MVGLPGAGKSTLSRELVKMLDDCEVIEYDEVEQSVSDRKFNPEIW